MNQTDNYVKDLNKALMNKALAYLSNFSSTENKLKNILQTFSKNHFKKFEINQVQKEIISIINRCKELGYINDEEFKKWVLAKWSIAPERKMKQYGHPAMFPEELVRRGLKLFSYKILLIT